MTVSQAEFLSLTTEWYRTFLQKPEEHISRVVFTEVTMKHLAQKSDTIETCVTIRNRILGYGG
jgi:hypothetical protein